MLAVHHESIRQGSCPPPVVLDGVDRDLIQQWHRFMLRLRRCELALIEAYRPSGEIRCPVHFCVGQEAVSASLSTLLQPQDYLFSHHRSHGYYLAKGAPMRSLFAELYGRATGANGGMAGSQEISYGDVNFYSGAILTGAVAIATGVALAQQLRKTQAIVGVGFGEGATDEGVFWEAVAYAALKQLPIVFVCENNYYTTFAPQPKHQATSICERVQSFGVPATAVFGNDVAAVQQVLKNAVERARNGGGASFVEAETYRWSGHVGPENDQEFGYRTQEELDHWKQLCPIKLLEEALQVKGQFDLHQRDRHIVEIDQEIQDALQFARSSPFPRQANWLQLNESDSSPLADRLLHDVEADAFDQNQQEAVPGPY
jgi:TPP-dependent pyruvate/acetoin dehydrogenase alpha subunit